MVWDEGETVIELPVPNEEPLPQPPWYHVHDAPVPKEPPLTDNVVELPLGTGFGEADAEPGAVELVLIVTEVLAESLQPLALVTVTL